MSELVVDWTTGQIKSSQSVKEGTEWLLVVCSDWAPVRNYAQPLLRDPSKFYGDILPVIRDATISVVNVECVLGGDRYSPIVKSGPNLCAPEEAVNALKVVPFHLACLANNHTMDYGPGGLAKMLRLLRENHIQTIGAGLSAGEAEDPIFFDLGDVRLAIINAVEGEEGRSVGGGPGVADFAQDRLCLQVTELKKETDVVVAICHAGREYVPLPPPYVYRTYRAIVDAGADLVVGHHPHVPQGVEIYNGCSIVYSLGNFCFWSVSPLDFRHLGFLFKARFIGSKLSSAEIIPYGLLPSRLTLLSGDDKVSFLSELEKISAVLKDPVQVEEVWNAFADEWFDRRCASEIGEFASSLVDEFILLKAILRRLARRFKIFCRHRLLGNYKSVVEYRSTGASNPSSPSQSVRGAIALWNRFETAAHRELYLKVLERARTGAIGTAPNWARNMLKQWGTFD